MSMLCMIDEEELKTKPGSIHPILEARGHERLQSLKDRLRDRETETARRSTGRINIAR